MGALPRKKRKTIHIRLRPLVVKELDRLASSLECSRSEFARTLLTEGLKQYGIFFGSSEFYMNQIRSNHESSSDKAYEL